MSTTPPQESSSEKSPQSTGLTLAPKVRLARQDDPARSFLMAETPEPRSTESSPPLDASLIGNSLLDRTVSARFVRMITRPAVSAPIVIVSLTMLAASLWLRQPASPLAIHARPPQTTAAVGGVASVEDMTAFRAQAEETLNQIVRNGEQLPRLIATIEQQARAAGFVTEITTRVPFPPVPGVPELICHPVSLRLENNYEHTEPTFVRLLTWLRQISTLGVKVDVATLSLQSLGDGVTTATVDLHLLSMSLPSDAKVAPE